MRLRWRRAGLAAALLLALWPFLRIGAAMPAFGESRAVLGLAINALSPRARHIANAVSAVNFDFRGFDTLGEEFMLMCAATGAVVLLRGSRGERDDDKAGRIPGRASAPPSEAVTLVSRLYAPLVLMFGVYLTVHATDTPGGGFQAGVIIAAGFLLLYFGDGYRTWRRMLPSPVFDALEGGGAVLFAACGLVPLLSGGAYLQNTLPLGKLKEMFSGGLVWIENAGVTLAVLGAFTLIFAEFMEETRAVKSVDDECEEQEG